MVILGALIVTAVTAGAVAYCKMLNGPSDNDKKETKTVDAPYRGSIFTQTSDTEPSTDPTTSSTIATDPTPTNSGCCSFSTDCNRNNSMIESVGVIDGNPSPNPTVKGIPRVTPDLFPFNQVGMTLICSSEACKLKAYKDSAGVWTIGWGNTYYPEGGNPKGGDVVTKQRADEIFLKTLKRDFINGVKNATQGVILNSNQFSALVSFAYNLGVGGLQNSTLLAKVKLNPNDPTIRNEFNKYVYAKGQKLTGLVKDRNAEADLYFTPSFL